MSGFKKGDVVVATNIEDTWYLTLGKEYDVQEVDDEFMFILSDANFVTWYNCSRFKLKEEEIVNEVNCETKQYIQQSTGLVYDLVFEGETMNVLKAVLDNREISVHTANLCPPIFVPYTKEMQKQTKKKQDLSTLETISETVKKCLDDDYVICHAKTESDNGVVTVNIVMGKAND